MEAKDLLDALKKGANLPPVDLQRVIDYQAGIRKVTKMFRFEVGAKILVRKNTWGGTNQVEVKILEKAPNMIKVKVLSDGWFKVGEIRWLSSDEWFTLKRV